MNARRGLAQGALLAALVAVQAAAGAADDGGATRSALEQRLKLVAALMADGPVTQRIVASGHARATAHLDEGRAHHARAVEAVARGDLEAARRDADDALRHLGLARRLVPDTPARTAQARQRTEQMQATLSRLIESWRQRAGPVDAEDGDLVDAASLMETARGFAREQRWEEAVHTLANAEGHVLTGMNRLLHARTLDYTARPATPAEEYQHELARLASLAELVPLAVNDLKPRPEALALIERYAETGAALRSQAVVRAQAGDLAQALQHLRNALMYVQRALATAGLVAPPASAGGTP